jgi:activator of HSP90 ATPase
MTRLSALGGDGGTSSFTKTSTSSSSSGGPSKGFASWTLPTGTTGSASNHSTNSSSSASSAASAAAATAGVRAPEGEMAIVFSDIARAASLWEFNAEAMRDATLLHNELMRSLLKKHRGYEVVFIRYCPRFLNFYFYNSLFNYFFLLLFLILLSKFIFSGAQGPE